MRRQRLIERIGAITRANRQLAAASIEQHRKVDATRAAEVEQFVQGCADGSARVKNIVDDDDVSAIDVERQR